MKSNKYILVQKGLTGLKFKTFEHDKCIERCGMKFLDVDFIKKKIEAEEVSKIGLWAGYKVGGMELGVAYDEKAKEKYGLTRCTFKANQLKCIFGSAVIYKERYGDDNGVGFTSKELSVVLKELKARL